MKKIGLLILLVFVVGCGQMDGFHTADGDPKIKNYIVHPTAFIKDPHFSEYKAQREALESKFLQKEITYAEYVEKKNEIDAKYTKEVQIRENIIQE